ncbi:hypothetical protein RHGRI_019338 [Rhododendron griersonianum]|uniref:Phytocyanin domain-containing protein n=1 Tax=Rhododendron griersonianum TaxID=479676 RepID=A0AAV6JG01_9ERIC|nr:hypothetical protein RHGRI_019338 [Rhododendron griersonianum]
MAVAFVLLVLSVAAPAAFATQHIVGGSSGWTQGVNYATWASSQTFAVGDTLLFSYDSSHSVDSVSQSDYNNCNVNSPQNSYTGGSTIISLPSLGTMYFICGTPGHCQSGMNLAVTVSAGTNGTSSPGGSQSPPPPPPHHASAATTLGNFGGKMFLLLEFSLLVVAFVGFMA